MRSLGIFLAMLALAALPAGAAAKPGHAGSGLSESATIRFQGSNGYRIKVEASAARESLIIVSAENGPAEVRYLLIGSLGADGSLDVHLPHVGRIAVEFDQTKVTRKRLPGDCRGHPSIVASGYFRGSIELHGERDYTTVDRNSARGRVVRKFRKHCGKRASGRERATSNNGNGKKEVFSTLVAAQEKGSPLLIALPDGGAEDPGTLVVASDTRYRVGMAITTSVSVEGGPDDLVEPAPGEPKVAELTPSKPFEGSARFELTSPRTSTWRGDLAVDLPGIGRTRLAGKSFESTLCSESHCTNTISAVLKALAELLATISGLSAG